MTIRVRYDVTFDAFDRALSELGRNWHSHVNVHGFDGGDCRRESHFCDERLTP